MSQNREIGEPLPTLFDLGVTQAQKIISPNDVVFRFIPEKKDDMTLSTGLSGTESFRDVQKDSGHGRYSRPCGKHDEDGTIASRFVPGEKERVETSLRRTHLYVALKTALS